MDEERDLVVFENDEGKQITMEVIDYLFYEGKEYALLTDYVENSPCEECDMTSCSGCDNVRDVIPMQVVPVDDENEEFVPIEDEKLANLLIDIFQNSDFDEMDVEFEEEDDEN